MNVGDRYYSRQFDAELLVVWVGKRKARLQGATPVGWLTVTVWIERITGADELEFIGTAA